MKKRLGKAPKNVLFANSITSLLVQFMAVASSFVVPRCILGAFGSVVNGTIESITGFLGFLTLMEAGVGSVARAALYQPVAENDTVSTSVIVNETKQFFQRVALLYLGFVAILAIVFPMWVDNGEGFWFNASLVLIVAVVHLVQYYFGAGYIQVLYADQKLYLLNSIQALAYFFNIVVVALCAWLGVSVHVMKLASSAVFLIRPLFVNIYVRRHYHISPKIKQKQRVLTQKWNNLLQMVAYFVHSKTDVVVLTVFCTMKTVSVYSVYALITTGLTSIINSLCSGFTARLGNLYGKGDQEGLRKTFSVYDHFILNIIMIFFTTASITILDFVRIYTQDIADADYQAPVFAMLLIVAEALYCLRLPYNNMAHVAGHFKQTQIAALLEAIVNIVISIAMVQFWGLVGVAIGTICAMLLRTLFFVFYLSKNILYLPVWLFWKKLLACCITVAISHGLWRILPVHIQVTGYSSWVLEAMLALFCVLVGVLISNGLFFRDMAKKWMCFLKKD